MSMTEPPDPDAIREYWQESMNKMNDQFEDILEQNVDSQVQFVEAWLEAIGDSMDDDAMKSAADGYRRAYETWMDAADRTVELSTDAVEGEDVSLTEVRDTWLTAANQSFKELMGTAAFAAATGRSVEESLDLRQQSDEITEATLHEFGLPSKGDIQEVGKRLVELERRQHAIEQQIDDLITAVEDRDQAQ